MATLRKLGEEGRERIAAEREQAQGGRGAGHARRGRPRPGREGLRAGAGAGARRSRSARHRAELAQGRGREVAGRGASSGSKREAAQRHKEALDQAKLEADQRVAAAEQRAAEAEAAAAEAHELAVRLEAEIEERVMQGTEDVRREADERVRTLVEKVEGEATEKARARAEEALKAESERIRAQAEQREERVRRAAEDEIKASTSRARREVLAAAEQTAPSWARREADRLRVRLPDLLDLSSIRPDARGADQGHADAGSWSRSTRAARSGSTPAGPTVYSRIHIGNARPFVVFSLLARFLKSEGYAAKLVVNVTDINDKIYVAARRGGGGVGGVRGADDPGLLRGHRPARPGAARCGAAGDRDDRAGSSR